MSEMPKGEEMPNLQRKITSLTEEVVRSYEELNLLYDLGDALSSAMNLDEITSLVLNMAWEVTGARCGILMLKDGDDLFARQMAGCNEDFTLKRGEGLPWKVLETGTVISVDDLSGEEFPEGKLSGFKNALCAPIKTKENPLGVLMLLDKEGEPFTSMDNKLLSAISAQTALYMESYLTHEMKMEERLQEADELHDKEIESIAEKFDFDDEMIEGFVADCMEPLADIDQQILSLEKGAGSEVIDALFRTMHTIKGTAKFFDFKNIAELSHAMEDVFGMLRDNKMAPESHVIDVLMDGIEGLKRILESINTNKSEGEVILTGLAERLKNLKEGKAITLKQERTPKEEVKDLATVREQSRVSDLAVRVPIEKLNRLTGLVQRMNNLAVGYLMDMKGRMEDGQFGKEGNHEGGTLGLLLSQVDKMYSDTQSQLMALRNVPIKNLFSRFPKMLRDISRELGKSINLEMSGEEVEIDRTILDEIGGSMVHIIRNSVDHGVEKPEKRVAVGKTEEGTVKIKGRQEGSEIVITVEDDGKGLDPEKIKKKALESGVISEKDFANITDKDAFQLIFMPGFSTAEVVTDISGRGVGMNVVKEVTGRLNGRVEISSEINRGTTFTIKIPSTVGITSAILLKVGEATYAIPSAIVDEVTNIRGNDIFMVNKKEVINYRDSVIPLTHLASILSGSLEGDAETKNKYPLLVVEVENEKRGLIVDRVIGRTEVMVSPFRGILMDSQYISGATFVGNELIPILDVNGIMDERKINRHIEGDESISFSGDGYDLGAEREFIVFELDGEPYGVGFGQLQEIIRYDSEPVPVPGMGDALVGIINLRNSIVPLLDFKRLGVSGNGNGKINEKPRVLIVGREGHSLGILADGVKEVCRIGEDAIENVEGSEMLNGEFFPLMGRVGEEIIKIVDIDRVVNYYRENQNVC